MTSNETSLKERLFQRLLVTLPLIVMALLYFGGVKVDIKYMHDDINKLDSKIEKLQDKISETQDKISATREDLSEIKGLLKTNQSNSAR
jgi:hypothetical protein